MADQNKWNIPGRGAAQAQIQEAVEFLCMGKTLTEREEVVQELVGLIRETAKGEKPQTRSDPLFERDEHEREIWARHVARHVVAVAMIASERMPSADRDAVLREIAKLALWHMPDAASEARELVRTMQIEGLKQPHERDSPPGR